MVGKCNMKWFVYIKVLSVCSKISKKGRPQCMWWAWSRCPLSVLQGSGPSMPAWLLAASTLLRRGPSRSGCRIFPYTLYTKERRGLGLHRDPPLKDSAHFKPSKSYLISWSHSQHLSFLTSITGIHPTQCSLLQFPPNITDRIYIPANTGCPCQASTRALVCRPSVFIVDVCTLYVYMLCVRPVRPCFVFSRWRNAAPVLLLKINPVPSCCRMSW